ncbi:MAG: helix-turn-helix transcriptional regulator [Christensenellaceae bacterium]|nr:helix-turn-helix transcriptional regulator [Christensenellaceae bacterium]
MNMEFEKKVGKKVRELRKQRGLTQEQLSAQLQTAGCDVTRSALAKIEVGQRHLYIDELKLLKELLKVDYADLL